MRVLKLFHDMGAKYRWSSQRNYDIVIRTKVGQEGVKKLFEEDLCPSIPFVVEVCEKERNEV